MGMAVHWQVIAGATKTSYLESLDCLLSATNSTTDTSVEYDEISMIFSGCKSLWNFVATSTTTASAAVSSGESGKNGANAGNEMMSWSSSDQYIKSGCSKEGGFKLVTENQPKAKKPRLEKAVPSSSNINFQLPCCSSASSSIDEPDTEAIAQMKEKIYRAAAFRPVNLGTEVEKPKRKNVRISTDPQTVAARQRRERISERIRVL
ncbi:Transcription factor bHLH87 [Hibiscus syriacus]|uniref:Transcription factor bHLH87 n=1 Tax=Hibiscus syriacus TaxID=106335 RepID=A0A6A2Y8B7_HIBSY|nr:Transcription factor bHLH87 [Hibiscus syriacus]